LIARNDPSTSSGTATAHLVQHAAGMGGHAASLKLTEQINTDLLCCLTVFQRNPMHRAWRSLRYLHTTMTHTGFWHLTLCTLLSSQGSDAPGALSRDSAARATSLTYHLQGRCQVDRPATRGSLPHRCDRVLLVDR
jgi:hypothetical protein